MDFVDLVITRENGVLKVTNLSAKSLSLLRLVMFDRYIPIFLMICLAPWLANAQGLSQVPDHIYISQQNTFSFELSIRSNGNKSKSLVEKLKLQHNLSEDIQLISSNPLYLTNNESTNTWNFYYQDTRLCFQQIVTATDGNNALVTGALPNYSKINTQPLEWDSLEQSSFALKAYGREQLRSVLDEVIYSEQCLWVHNQTLIPVWYIWLKGQAGTWRGIANAEKVFHWSPGYFDVTYDKTASATIYSRHRNSAQEQYELNDMSSDGILENKSFVTYLDQQENQDLTRAIAPDFNFDFSKQSNPLEVSNFQETSVFTNANRVLAWFKSIGFKGLSQDNKMRLFVHATFNGNKNNARYEPATKVVPPTLFIGDGDGINLQDLAIDSDIVTHEFAHHVIYQNIKVIVNDAAILHEALADFFAFSMNGDACLGDTICPAGSNSCYLQNQCIRSGDTDLRLDDNNLPEGIHNKSQFFSGFLWDLHIKDQVPLQSDLAPLVLQSLSFMPEIPTYRDMLLAMLYVDKTEYYGNYCEIIIARAQNRGMGELIDFGCDASKFPIVNENEQANLIEFEGEGQSCGVIGMNKQQQWQLLLILILPCLYVMIARKKRPLVRIRSKHRRNDRSK